MHTTAAACGRLYRERMIMRSFLFPEELLWLESNLFFAFIGMIVLAVLGSISVEIWEPLSASLKIFMRSCLGLVGALIGLVLTPFLTTRPARYLVSVLGKLSLQTLAAGLMGMVIGLLIAALLAFPLSLLPRPFSQILPFVGVIIFGYLGVVIFVMRQKEIFVLFFSRWQSQARPKASEDGVDWHWESPFGGCRPKYPAGYQRDHRWADCRYRPDRFSGRDAADPALCAE